MTEEGIYRTRVPACGAGLTTIGSALVAVVFTLGVFLAVHAHVGTSGKDQVSRFFRLAFASERGPMAHRQGIR